MAVEAVTVAFRTGMLVADIAQRVEASNASDGSWSMIVPGLSSAEAVQRACEESVRRMQFLSYKFHKFHADMFPT